jgi:hypothetical protein
VRQLVSLKIDSDERSYLRAAAMQKESRAETAGAP